MTRLRALWDRLRGTYWAVPSAMAIASLIFSIVMVALDEALTDKVLSQWSWVYTGGAEGARAVLSTIAASMITVAGVTFSITIVALTLASQQFGPRLLRNFLRDLGNQITIGTFIATFIYCLLVLRTVRGHDDTPFVPHLAVTVGVVMAMLSLGVLIFFIHHVATSIQASQVVANVATDLDEAIDRLFPDRIGQGPHDDRPTRPATDLGEMFADAHAVEAIRSGYVQAIDGSRLVRLARTHDLRVRVEARPGEFVRRGSLLLSVPRAAPSDEVEAALRESFIIGADRSGTQDVGFFVNQLVELAVRALSPGINDPATACMCIDRLEAALCLLAGRAVPSDHRYDEDDILRVVARTFTFAEMLDVAFTEIAHYGRSSISVSCRLLEALRALAQYAPDEDDRRALRRHAVSIGDRRVTSFTSERDHARVAACYRATITTIAGAPRP